MKDQGKLITGVLVGASAMYLLDPDRGARRRSLLRDQGVHAGHKLGDGLAATARDARNRTRGTAAALRARFRSDSPDEDVLHERVRSAIGRAVSHPGAITVVVTGELVTLTGQVNNLFDRRYATAALLGSTAFTATGSFVARPFPAAGGEFPLTHSTFYAPGAPIRAWAGLRVRF